MLPSHHTVSANRELQQNQEEIPTRGVQKGDLPWMSILETGVKELDVCHRKLIAECNELLALRLSSRPLEDIAARAHALANNCIKHFDVEEELMRQTDFPRVEQHIAEHRRMREELPRLVAALAQSGSDALKVEQSLDALRFSLIELLLHHDLDYRSHLLHSQGR